MLLWPQGIDCLPDNLQRQTHAISESYPEHWSSHAMYHAQLPAEVSDVSCSRSMPSLLTLLGSFCPLFDNTDVSQWRMQIELLELEQAQAHSQAEASLQGQQGMAQELACQRMHASQLASTFEAALASAAQDHAAHVQVKLSSCFLQPSTEHLHGETWLILHCSQSVQRCLMLKHCVERPSAFPGITTIMVCSTSPAIVAMYLLT